MAKDNNNAVNEEVQEVQVVAFKLRKEEYGVSILNVQEIKNLTDITRVPFASDFIKGVINLRGSVLPVIDLKKRLGLQETPYTDSTRIIIMKIDEISIGMIVDAVTEVLTVDTNHIDTTKSVSDSGDGSRFIDGIGNINDRLVIMLNLDEIIGLPAEAK